MEKLKKILKNKKVASLTLGVVLAASLFVGTFAWFTGTIPNQGVDVNSGKLNAKSNAYTYNPTPTEDDPILRRSSETAKGEGASVVASIEEKANDNIYFIVERGSESIDVDYLITWTLENGTTVALTPAQAEEEAKYIGGFWYKFSKINDYVTSATYRDHSTSKITYTRSENLLASFIEDNPTHPIIIGDRTTSKAFSEIGDDPIRGDLKETAYTDYYIMNYWYGSEISELANRTLQLRMNVDYAQIGGLPGEERDSSTIYVSTATQFKSAITSYLPGQTIRVTGNITYDRDLVLQAPVHIEIAASTLTIQGNLIVKYPYQDTSSIDTSASGKLFVVTKNGYGGNLDVKVPQGKFIFIGKASSTAGDIYVQNTVTVDGSYDDDKGIVFEKCNVFTTTSSGGASTERKVINFKNNTRIEVFSNTIVQKLFPSPSVETGDTAPEFVKIVNHGTIYELNFQSLNYVSGTYISKPQIDVDNYGIIGKSGYYIIDLPYWATKFGYDEEEHAYYGNCRLRQEITSNEFTVNCPSKTGFDNPFTNEDIERDELTEYVIENPLDHNDVTIYYRNHNNTTYTLADIIKEHYGTETINPILNRYTKLKVICSGLNTISSTDHALFNQCKNLITLDLEDAVYTNNRMTTDYPFQYCTNLVNLTLPKTIEYLPGCVVAKTLVRELTIPASVNTVHRDCFFYWRDTSIPWGERVTYYHIKNTEKLYTDLNYDCWNYAYIMLVDPTMVTTYRTKYPNHVTTEEGLVSDNYQYVYSKNEDDEYYKLHFYAGEMATDSFTIDTINFDDGTKLKISKIGDYAFYRVANSKAYNNIILGDKVKSLGNYCFYSLNAKYIDLCNCETIGNYCFYQSKLTQIDADYVNYVGYKGFSASGALREISFPSLTTTGDYAFYDTDLLEYVYAPNYCNYSAQAFGNCAILTEVYIGIEETSTFAGTTDNGNSIFRDTNQIRFVYLCGTSVSSTYALENRNFYYDLCPHSYASSARYIINKEIFNDYKRYFTFNYSDYDYTVYQTFIDGDPKDFDTKSGEHYITATSTHSIPEYLFTLYDDGGSTKANLIGFAERINNITGDYHTPDYVTYKGVDYPVGRIDKNFATYTFNVSGDFIFSDNTTELIAAAGTQNYLVEGTTGTNKKIGGDVICRGVIKLDTYGLLVWHITGDVYFPNLVECADWCFAGHRWDGGDNRFIKCNNLYLPKLTKWGKYFLNWTSISGGVYLDGVTEIDSTGLLSETHGWPGIINSLYFNNLITVNGNMFTSNSQTLTINNFYAPKLTTINGNFGQSAIYFDSIDMPELKTVTGFFLYYCCTVTEALVLPKLETVGSNFFYYSCTAKKGIYVPSLISCNTIAANSYVSIVYAPSLVTRKGEIAAIYDCDVWYIPNCAVSDWYFMGMRARTGRDAYVKVGNGTNYQSRLGASTVQNIYFCGDGLFTDTQDAPDRSADPIHIYCKSKNYNAISKVFTLAKGYIVINTGDVDPADLFYTVSPTGTKGYYYNFPDYQYVIKDDKAYAIATKLENITSDVFTIGGDVEVLNYLSGEITTYELAGIGDRLFYTTNISSQTVEIKNTVTEINASCFENYNSNKTIETVYIDSLGAIGEKAFFNIPSLSTVILGENVNSLGDRAFGNCSSTCAITIKNKDSMIPDGTAFGTTIANSMSVKVPGQVYSQYQALTYWHYIPRANIACYDYIYDDTTQNIKFYYSLNDDHTVNVIFAESSSTRLNMSIPTQINTTLYGLQDVTVVEATVMGGVNGVINLTLPDRLVRYKYFRDSEPASLEAYIIATSNTNYTTLDGILYNKDVTTLISFPKAKTVSDNTFHVPSTVTNIPSYSCAACTYLESVVIEGNTRVSSNAFNATTALRHVICNGNVRLESYAFENLNLTDVTFNAGADINGFAFKDCASLIDVTFETTSVANIHSYAFSDMNDNLVVTFKSSTPSIFDGYNTFGSNSKYIVRVPDADKQAYINNILFDISIEGHIQGVSAA